MKQEVNKRFSFRRKTCDCNVAGHDGDLFLGVTPPPGSVSCLDQMNQF